MINWKVRIKNKAFWLALIPAVLLLVKQVLAIGGISIDILTLSDQLKSVIETIFVILAIVGVVNDPTTSGISDSSQALTYDEPKED